MYSIGEYARIAQVSKRLLRYYDEIGLFQPVKIDRDSGHRYYSATQLPELNRILALKELVDWGVNKVTINQKKN